MINVPQVVRGSVCGHEFVATHCGTCASADVQTCADAIESRAREVLRTAEETERKLAEARRERDSLQLSRLDRRDPRVNVLRLLADQEISVGKACEALNEIAAGQAPVLPQPIDPDRYDDERSWRDLATALEADLAAMRLPRDPTVPAHRVDKIRP